MTRRRKKRLKIKNFLLLIIFIGLLSYATYYIYSYLYPEEDLVDKVKDIINNTDSEEETDSLEKFNYSKDEIKVIRNNLEESEIEKIDKYYKNLSEYTKVSYFHIENIDRYDTLKEKTNYTNEEIIMRVNTNLDRDFYTNIKTIDDPDDLLVLVNKYYKLPEGYIPDDLTSVEGVTMRKEAAEALSKLAKDMRSEGLTINLHSGYRSENTQRSLYENYASADGYDEADTYSARPSHSEHQTGLAIDMTDNWSLSESFDNTDEFKWLSENTYKYGFILRYRKDNEYMTGYMYEPWHYRYVGKEVAKIIYENNLTYEEYCVLYKNYY